MRLYVIAGEASGDLHAANLIKAMRVQHADLDIRGWGGDRMEAEGVDITRHIRDLAFMGFTEVIINLKTILGNISYCKDDIRRFAPDAVILVDYPGFNLRIAPFVKKLGIKVLYYISPQIWAWKSNRVHAIKKHVDEMYTILPFEEEFYGRYGMQVHFVGHPLLDELKDYSLTSDVVSDVIALLPGSRKQEIGKMLPVMLKMRSKFPKYKFKVAAAPSIEDSFYRQIGGADIDLVRNGTYPLLSSSAAALVTSGTATLECALIGTPEVVCYRGSGISYQIAKRLVKLKFISLVNLIMDQEVVRELIQSELNPKNLHIELSRILEDADHRSRIKNSYKQMRERLGGIGASARCAAHMLKTLEATD
ncbi:MAG: lipid-A-disaccharide synthase [Flavobacteriales bacterium]|nr:lipid-A-disaccharide synthase [Flavobacteriales bacterium]